MGLAAQESSVSLQRIQGPIDLFPERNAVKPIGHGLVEVFGTTVGLGMVVSWLGASFDHGLLVAASLCCSRCGLRPTLSGAVVLESLMRLLSRPLNSA